MSVDSLASAPPFQYKFLTSSDVSEQLRRQNGASHNIVECLQSDTESQVLASLLQLYCFHCSLELSVMSYFMKNYVAN